MSETANLALAFSPPRTIRRFAEADDVGLLLGQTLGRSSLLNEFKPYLLSRIQEGHIQANQLHAEIQARGWHGSGPIETDAGVYRCCHVDVVSLSSAS